MENKVMAYMNPTRSNMTLGIVIPQLKKLLAESPDHVLAAVQRQSMKTALDAFTHPEMQAQMVLRVQEAEAAPDSEVANQFRREVGYVLDHPTDKKVQQAVASAKGNLKDFLIQVTEKIIEVSRRA